MRKTKKFLSLLMTIAMLASLLSMTGLQANAASVVGRKVENFSGMYFTANKFKILQLADIQTTGNGGAMTGRTVRAIKLAIQRYDPDLIICTGDQIQGSSNESQWKASFERIKVAIQAAKTQKHPDGFPISCVAMTMGNHDGESSYSRQSQQDWYVSQGCIDFDNNFSDIDLYGNGTGCVPIAASSGNADIAFNVVLFDSNSSGYNGGYSRIGHTSATDYNNIINWYDSMTKTLADSSYKKSLGKSGPQAYVPVLCAQHTILQEIYTTGGLVQATGSDYGVSSFRSFTHGGGIKSFRTNDYSAGLNESPCCTAGTADYNASTGTGSGDTWAQYDKIRSLGNCIGFTFGHDHDNYFDVTDNNGMRFLAASGLTQENYLTDNDPGVRYFELTLNESTGDVTMWTENRKYSQMVQHSGSVDTGRFEAVSGDGSQVVNTISSPKLLFVGGAANDINTQEFGTILQTNIIDYKTKQVTEQYRTVKVCVPSDVSGVSLKVIKPSGSTLGTYFVDQSTTVGNTKVFNYTLGAVDMGSTGALSYEATYTTEGKSKTIYGVSHIRDIEMPGGYNTYVRGYAGSDYANYQYGWISQKHVSMVHGFNVYSQRRGMGYYDGNSQVNGGYYMYGGAGEPDVINYTFRDKHTDARYSLWQRSPSRVRDYDGVALPNDYMQIRPGESPLSTIYVDKAEKETVSGSDKRLLSGASLTYFITKDLDNNVPEYVAGVGFRTEDYLGNAIEGFSPINHKAWFTDEMATIPNGGYSGNPDGVPLGNFAYEDYAPSQSMNGITTTHTNGNYLEANNIGTLRDDCLSFPIVSTGTTWPSRDTTLTMVAGTRSQKNSNGWATMLYVIELWRLNFRFYDKSNLSTLVLSEMTAARQQSDYPNATLEYTVYKTALKAAQAVCTRPDVSQTEIDNAEVRLKNARTDLENTDKVPDTGHTDIWYNDRAGSLQVPHTIYVNGTTIQTAAPYTARDIVFTVPAGSTNVTCKAVTGDNNDSQNSAIIISSPSVNGTTYTWTVTGGSATAGGQINYMINYAKNGVVYTQYAASYVRSIPQHKAAWMFSNRNTNGSSKGYAHSILWRMDFQDFFSAEGYIPVAGNMIDGMQSGVMFYGGAYSRGEYLLNGTNASAGWDAMTQGIFCDQSGSSQSDWGSDGATSNDYVGVDIYYDKQYNTVNRTIKAFVWRFPEMGAADYHAKTQDSNQTITVSSFETERLISGWENNGEAASHADIAGFTTTGYPMGENESNNWNLSYAYIVNFTGSNALNGNKYIRIRNYIRTKEERINVLYRYNQITQFMAWYINFKAADRTAAHTAIDLALMRNYPKAQMKSTWWNSYRVAALGNYRYIGNLQSSVSDGNAAALTDLLNSPVYVDADYTNLLNAVNTYVHTSAGTDVVSSNQHGILDYYDLCYSVSGVHVEGYADEDSRYAGQWYTGDMFSDISILALRSALESRVNLAYKYGASDTANNLNSSLLDFRFQASIDNAADAIISAGNKLRLANADYTSFDVYKNLYNDADKTMFFDMSLNAASAQNSADRTFANGGANGNGAWWQEGIFTNSTITDFISSITIDRTLKRPSEQAVIGSLPRIYPADISNPGTTACLYNTARTRYEALAFRVASEYFSATGSATVDGATYYANYHKVANSGTYIYTADFSSSAGTASTTYFSLRSYPKVVAAWADAWNGGINITYNRKNGSGAVIGTVNRYTDRSWDAFYSAYDAAITNKPASGLLALYVQRDIMPNLALLDYCGDSLIKNSADLTAVISEIGTKANYEPGGSGYQNLNLGAATGFAENPTTGATWYTASTWSNYSTKKAAADMALTAGYLAEQQETVNTIAKNLYEARCDLVSKKIGEYNADYKGETKTFDQINAIILANDGVMNDGQTLVTLTAAGTLNETSKINKYNTADVSAWNSVYGGNSGTGYAYYTASKNTLILAESFAGYRAVLSDLDNKFTNKRDNNADYSQLEALVNGTTEANYYWRAKYDIGGTGYNTNGLGSATGFAENPTNGATWYTSDTWNAYSQKRNAGVATLMGSGTYDYNTVYFANQGGTVETKQDAINAKVKELYTALMNLQPKKLTDYNAPNGAWFGKTTYSEINAKALANRNEINEAKVIVKTIEISPTVQLPGAPAGYDVGEEERLFYDSAYITNINSAYSLLEGYNSLNANKDLAITFNDYRAYLASNANIYNANTTPSNINAADYSHLDTLLHRAWIPKYDTKGANTLGEQFSGAYWYKADSWHAYANARNAAAQLVDGADYNVCKGDSYGYGAGDKRINEQAAINTAVENLVRAYYGLRYKTVDEFTGTWNGATGYADVTELVESMAAGLDATIDVWTQFEGEGDLAQAKTVVTRPYYNESNVATVLAMQAALLGNATDNVNNIRSSDVLAEKYNAYLSRLAAYQTAVDNCMSGGLNPVYLDGWNWIFSQLNTAEYPVTEVTLTRFIGNMTTVSTTAITDIIGNKSDLVLANATVTQQNVMNNYALDLYKELVNTKVGDTAIQVSAAKAAANAKKAATVNVYDPYQLGGRTAVTILAKYTAESVAALDNVIAAADARLAGLSLWDAKPAEVGYTQLSKETDGSLANSIWAATGIDSASTGAAHPESGADYKLVLAPLFTASLNDAVAFAKSTLYVDPSADTPVKKTITAVNPDGDDYTYNTFTTDSENELIAALAAVDTTGMNIMNQATVDRWVCDIIENTDIENTVKVKTTNGVLYGGELTTTGEDEGLKYNDAYYGFLTEQIQSAKVYEAGSAGATIAAKVWNSADNNSLITETVGEETKAKGAHYYIGWSAYESALKAGMADSGDKKSDGQEAVDALAAAIFSTREALTLKPIEQLDHSFGEWAVTTPATCTQDGEETRVCFACNHIETRAISATGHTPAITPAVASTCTVGGLTEGKHCSVCNEIIVAQETVSALGHSFGEWAVTTPATCTQDGEETRICFTCNHIETRAISATGHTPAITPAVASTCTVGGLTEGKHCSVCNEIIVAQETVSALGHSFGEWITITEPTPDADGQKKRVCSVCSEEEFEAIPRLILMGIEIAALPTNTTYTYKKTASTAGMKVVARYSDGSEKDITSEVNVTGFDTSSKGNHTATVEFAGKTDSFTYTVKYAWWQWIIRIVLFGWLWY